MELLKEFIIPWSISNIVAVGVLLCIIFKPKIARLLFAIMFFSACWLNFSMAHYNPSDYLDYSYFTPIKLYKEFINGWFKEHIKVIVTLISIGQGLIAIGMISKGWIVQLACIGAVIFFMAITPLGIGSAFPFTIITSIAVCFILKNDDLNYLWNIKKSSF